MLDRTGLILTAKVPAPLTFLDSVLRGIGQVMLQNNAYAGVLFLIGIFLNSALFGSGVIVGTVVSTLTAQALGAKTSDVRAGLYGFNGALVAIALLYFLEPNALTWGCVVLASACSTVLMAALMQLFKVFNLPVLTAPFVFTSLGFFLAIARFGRLQSTQQLPTAGLPQSTAVEGIVTHATVIEGLLGGVAQVFFQASVLTGVIFVAALLISSWRACVMALLGSLLGVLIAWGMGAAEPAIRAGAFGFNSVLTAIALGSVFLRPGLGALVYTVLGCAATTVVYAGLSAALEPIGMPAMTLPFVLVTWVFVAATPLFARLRAT